VTVGGLLFGGRPPISNRELLYWGALHQFDPIGRERNDFNSAQICSTIANVHLPRYKHTRPKDFMPFGRPKQPQSDDLIASQLAAMAQPKKD